MNIPVFDLHCDTALELLGHGEQPGQCGQRAALGDEQAGAAPCGRPGQEADSLWFHVCVPCGWCVGVQ